MLASVKADKVAELFIPRNGVSMQKRLLQIYASAVQAPNSGYVARALTKYYDLIDKNKKLSDYDNPLSMLGIAVNLALKNQKSYQWCMAVVSKILDYCEPEDRLAIIEDVRRKFDRLPNTGLLDIWLQRISYKIDPTLEYAENKLTLLVRKQTYPGNHFWQCSWLRSDIRDIVLNTPIVESTVLHTITKTIERTEVELFKLSYRAWQ